MTTAFWLWLLAITLIWPVPAGLARARWLLTVPRAAVVLWQAVAVAALLAVFGASLATVQALALRLLMPDAARRSGASGSVEFGPSALIHLSIAAALLTLTVIALVKLNFAGIQVARRLRRHRRRHRDLIDLLARTGAPSGHAPDVRILDTGQGAFAYCLPGRHSRVVISDAALRDLTPEQVAAVIEHERAHLRARHDLLLEFFTVLYEAAGRRAGTAAALEQTAVLVELLADDSARRRHGSHALLGALGTLGTSTTLHSPAHAAPMRTGQPTRGRTRRTTGPVQPDHAPAKPADPSDPADPQVSDPLSDTRHQVSAHGVLARLRRLTDTPVSTARSGLAIAVYSVALALLAVPTVTVALPWLTSTYQAVR